MLVIENQHVVRQLASSAADEALRDRVHVRCPHGDLDHARPGTLGNVVEGRPVFVVSIAQQDLRSVSIHRGVPQLLRRPFLRRVPGRGDVHDSPRGQVDDEEGIDLPEDQVVVWMKSQAHVRSA